MTTDIPYDPGGPNDPNRVEHFDVARITNFSCTPGMALGDDGPEPLCMVKMVLRCPDDAIRHIAFQLTADEFHNLVAYVSRALHHAEDRIDRERN